MKNKLISAAIVLVLLSLFGFKAYQHYYPDKVQEVNIFNQTNQPFSNSQNINQTDKIIEENNPISFKRQEPVSGVHYGVIEVGASGFNLFVVSIDNEKNWEMIYKEFGSSLAYEGFLNIDELKTGIRKYLSKMFDNGVSGKNAHFVVSSGALKNPKTDMVLKAIKELGYVVNRVTPEQEGKFAYRALISKEYESQTFMCDIGSGNTKISFIDNNNNLKAFEGPGAKYYSTDITDTEVKDQITSLVKHVPINKRKYCFIIGGVPFKMAEISRKENERFTRLNKPNYYNFQEKKLTCGLNIYSSIYDQCNNIIFDWDANFTIGFLLNLKP